MLLVRKKITFTWKRDDEEEKKKKERRSKNYIHFSSVCRVSTSSTIFFFFVSPSQYTQITVNFTQPVSSSAGWLTQVGLLFIPLDGRMMLFFIFRLCIFPSRSSLSVVQLLLLVVIVNCCSVSVVSGRRDGSVELLAQASGWLATISSHGTGHKLNQDEKKV